MSISVQIAGSIVKSGVGELDLVADFQNRASVSDFEDLSLTIDGSDSHAVTGVDQITTLALIVEEGEVEITLTFDGMPTTFQTSKFLVLTGINASAAEVTNTSDSEPAKVRLIVGG